MVQSIIDLSEENDRVLNIVKAVHGLKNKSEAVALITQIYEEKFLGKELKSEYVERIQKIRKGKYIKFGSIDELDKHIKSKNAQLSGK